ncbi:MAG: DNA repair protein RadC [Crocinitomicaceae bacterium]|nr:MAG: DNA repair protein RadC [Crocinitomicaceae bacterium]
MNYLPVNRTIKMWAEDDRPREKLILKGRNSLSDAELLAILIGSGTREKSAVELAQEMLQFSENNLQQFSKLTLTDLCKFKGIGEAKAISIIAALELGRRRKGSEQKERIKIRTSSQVYQLLHSIYEDLRHEEFHIILMNRANEVIRIQKISQGGTAVTAVDAKVIFKAALDYNAATIVLSHNHPSGLLVPSENDLRLTRELVCFGKIMDLLVVDHIIYTDNGYFSFSDQGVLS